MITKSEIEHLAKLSRLYLTDAERETLAKEMDGIVDMAAQLQQLDLDSVELTLDGRRNVLREDVVLPSYPRDEILKNAPVREAGCFSVPKTVE